MCKDKEKKALRQIKETQEHVKIKNQFMKQEKITSENLIRVRFV